MHAAQGLGWVGWGALTKHYTRTGLEARKRGSTADTAVRVCSN